MNKVKHLLRRLKRILDKTFGTVIDEFFWRLRSEDWAKAYLSPESLSHPHRKFLIERIAKHAPFESVLEVGCASGPNLALLASKFPNIKLYGTDINKNAIKYGREWFRKNFSKELSLSLSLAEN